LIKLRVISKAEKSLFHAHLPRAELLTRFAVGKNEYVVSRHNAEPFFPGAVPLFSSYLSRLVIRKAKHVIAISFAVSDFLINEKEIIGTKKLSVVHYGYQPRPREDRITANVTIGDGSGFCIGTISRLTRQKDLPTLFSAFAQFLMGHPKSTLLLVGGGEEKNQLEILAQNLGIDENIEWVGRTSKIPEFLSRMDIFVLSSLYEGFGLVLLEAMDAGVPIIASNNSAIPEVLGEDFTGLVKTGDVEGFVTKMNEYTNQTVRDKVRRDQDIRLKAFSAEVMCSKISKIYSLTH
jgi:glycosyltransferase involved in cell wall biosynthesis